MYGAAQALPTKERGITLSQVRPAVVEIGSWVHYSKHERDVDSETL
jgi:hypothetical protein